MVLPISLHSHLVALDQVDTGRYATDGDTCESIYHGSSYEHIDGIVRVLSCVYSGSSSCGGIL